MLLLVRQAHVLRFVVLLIPLIGYVADNTQKIRGLSPLHDSGTGSSLGRDLSTGS